MVEVAEMAGRMPGGIKRRINAHYHGTSDQLYYWVPLLYAYI